MAMTVYMKKDATVYYGLESEYPREDDWPMLVNDYIFETEDFRLANLFYIIVEHYTPSKDETLNYSPTYTDPYGEELTYSVIFTCTESTRLHLEYIFRAGMKYAFMNSYRLLKGHKVQNYSINQWI